MISTKEMLSFPKVAKNVRAKYNTEHKDFTWRVKANDGNILIYGSREYIQNIKKINRLLTAHSKTEYGERREKGGDGQTKSALPPLFNDSDFRKSTDDVIVANSKLQSQAAQGEKAMDMLRQEYEENSSNKDKINKTRKDKK
ncbi:hypothetical protein [uncultured Campylobacter sp.]|uniref:hypothetical protein n=1 Tax=uncultured Campylobacter sp. TaxID=218934 RepID=UPI0026019A3E|nr:hypothetical protein [uncultured Campylobacter sp.]